MKSLLTQLHNLQLDDVCNPYSTNCVGDHLNSASIRLENLHKYLKRIEELQPDIAWFGEALGHRGGRRSGLPFSDDLQIETFNETYGISAEIATEPPAVGEVTAKIIWDEILHLDQPPLLWNVFPFHPYGKDHGSNRKPRIRELEATASIIHDILELSQPTTILAVGRTAESWLQRLGYETHYIRHPSYGGISAFREHIQRYYQ